MTIGSFLETLRRERGLTQREVGEALGVSDRTVSAWETDARSPDIFTLSELAAFYGVTADEILHGRREERTSAPRAAEPCTPPAENSEAGRLALKKRTKFSAWVYGLSGFLIAAIAAVTASAFLTDGVILIIGLSGFFVAFGLLMGARVFALNVPKEMRTLQRFRVRRILYRALYLCAGAMGLVFLLVMALCVIPDDQFSFEKEAVVPLAVAFAAVAFAVCFWGSFRLYCDVLRFGDERARAVSARNRETLIRCYIFGMIPVFLAVICFLICGFAEPRTSDLLFRGAPEETARYLQTVTISPELSWRSWIPEGEVFFDLSASDPEADGVQPLGGGLACEYDRARGSVRVGALREGEFFDVAAAFSLTADGTVFWPLRFGGYDAVAMDCIYRWSAVRVRNADYAVRAYGGGEFAVWFDRTYDIFPLGQVITASLLLADGLVCALVCAVRYRRVGLDEP